MQNPTSALAEPAQETPSPAPFEDAGLTATFVCMRDEEAIALARAHYGLDAQVTRFATEKDDTFRLQLADGQRLVLKVANPSEPEQEIDLQVRLLEHVEQRSPDIPVPRVVRDRAGRSWSWFTDTAGQHRIVRVMSYVEGTPLDSIPSTAAGRMQVGRMLARLRLATADFSHAAQDRIVAWDVQNVMQLQPLIADVDDVRQRERLATGMRRVAAIQPRVRALRRQVVHNDFSQSNIVVDAAHPSFVTGIIDFGDAVRTAVAIDVSTALLNQLPRTGVHADTDLFAAGRDLLRGYLEVADLTDEERALLPHLTLSRVVTRALLSLWRARRFPHNATYLLRNTEPGWNQLDWFLARSDEALEALL